MSSLINNAIQIICKQTRTNSVNYNYIFVCTYKHNAIKKRKNLSGSEFGGKRGVCKRDQEEEKDLSYLN